jgi:hypothetical protein
MAPLHGMPQLQNSSDVIGMYWFIHSILVRRLTWKVQVDMISKLHVGQHLSLQTESSLAFFLASCQVQLDISRTQCGMMAVTYSVSVCNTSCLIMCNIRYCVPSVGIVLLHKPAVVSRLATDG